MAQQKIPLYSGVIPNAISCNLIEEENPVGKITHVTQPELIAWYPAVADSNKTALIVCPGGGYARLAIAHEGSDIADFFNKLGITVFILKYRLPNDTCMTNKKYVPLQDVQQAMNLLRTKADSFHINPTKIGIIGFSAGGHLAAMLSNHYNYPAMPFAGNDLLRPNFSILLYPVISMLQDSVLHSGSHNRLLGKNATIEEEDFFSCQLQVSAKTPPTFIAVAADDKTVNPINSINYYQALLQNKVPAALHVYQSGGHGFGLKLPNKDSWTSLVQQWLLLNKFITAK